MKSASAKLQDCARGAAATERLRPGRELRSRAVDTFRQAGYGGLSTPLLPDLQIILGSLNIDIVSHTSQDKKAARNQERLIIFARTIIWYSFAHRCAAEHPKNHEMSIVPGTG